MQATGILWMITLMARTVMSASSLKTPMARPSTILWRIKAIPNVVKLLGSNLDLVSAHADSEFDLSFVSFGET